MQLSSRQPLQDSSSKCPKGDNYEETPPSRHLWVGNVSQDVTEGLLMDNFSKFGPIERVTVYSHRNYAFINFRNLDDAQDAKNGLQGVALGGLAMRIEYAKGAKPSRHLWVGGISKTVSKEQIEGEFKRFGIMQDFKFLRDRNCAFVDFEKIEDAIAAVDSLNRKHIGEEEICVDFGRSHPPKRDNSGGTGISACHEERDLQSNYGWDHSDQLRILADMKSRPGDGYVSQRGTSFDAFTVSTDRSQGGSGSCLTAPASGRSREKEEPSDVLWVGFPLLSKVDEEGLHRAFVPYGEVERVKTFPGRTYAFVQFKNVEEASRAKHALEGKLFNDPRVHIRFSNSEIGPVDNPRTESILASPLRGRETSGFSEKATGRPLTSNRFCSVISPLHPVGLRPEYYPGGLARGAALAKALGNSHGTSISLGNSVTKLPGPVDADSRVPLDERELRTGRQRKNSLSGFCVRPGGTVLYEEHCDLLDEETFREPKRMRILEGGRQFTKPKNLGPRSDSSRRHSSQSTNGIEHLQGSGVQRVCSGSVQLDGLGHATGGQGLATIRPGPPVTGPGPGPPCGFTGPGKTQVFSTEGFDEGWQWHGTISKGGTPVCRAQCLPVGKGIDVTVPDIVNCTARTDLDMLAKHVYQADDFGVVFFVPEADPDVSPYHDFMHYLGEKHRAGVAKLADGTTLFLVPPSEFSERVLKVPGNNCLFGVVLKPKQPSSLESAQLLPPPAPASQPRHLLHQQSLPTQHPKFSHLQDPVSLSRSSVEEDIPLSGHSHVQGQPAPISTNSSLAHSQLNSLASRLPGILTPELIVSLRTLLPRHNHPLVMGANALQQPARAGIGGGRVIEKRAPVGSTFPTHSVDNKMIYWPSQSNQQSVSQSQRRLSSLPDQLPVKSGHVAFTTDQDSVCVRLSQQLLPPQTTQTHCASNTHLATPRLPASQSQQGYPALERRQMTGPVYGGQQMLQQATPSQYLPPLLRGGTPVLPSDQLAQLTALLTQKQQQPAQQQQVAQLLQQHCQQQQAQLHTLSELHQLPHLLPVQQFQVQAYSQEPQQHVVQASQQIWDWSGTMLQESSPSRAHLADITDGSSGGWDGAPIAHVQQHHLVQALPSQPHISLSQHQFLHPPSMANVTSEQAGATTTHDDAERQKRFQATLQLAAALLQQMQEHHQTPGQALQMSSDISDP